MSDVNKEIALYPMSGDKVRFVSTAKLPIGGFETELHPIQDLHGQEYPYPAGGGANKYNPNTELERYKLGATTGQLEVNANYCTSDYIEIEENTNYYLINVCVGSEAICVAWYDSNKGFISKNTLSGSDHKASGSLTSPSGSVYARVVHYNGVNEVAFNYPSTVTAYAPYSNICPITGHDSMNIYVSPTPEITDETKVHSIEFGQTVYGGTLTINEDGSGQIVSTMASVDLGTLNWSYNSTYSRFVSNGLSAIIKQSDNTKRGNIVCSLYKTETANHTAESAYDHTIGVGTTGAIVIRDTSYTDATSFKQMLTDTNAQIVYELAEPITINLTVEQIETLIGFNYVWNNVGTTNIVFQYYTGGEGMAITFLDCWTYPKAKLDEMFKAVNDRLEALEESSEQASADSNARTTLLETKEEVATEPVAEVEREGDE